MALNEVTILVDASRCRSGGSLQHFYSLFVLHPPQNSFPVKYIIYASRDIKKILPQNVLYNVRTLRYDILAYELFWQYFILPIIYRLEKAHLIFTLDSSSLCEVRRQVVLNQDILCFSLESIEKRFSLIYLRQVILKLLSRRRLQKALSAIFLTEYAKNLYCKVDTRISNNSKVIPHGFASEYLSVNPPTSLTDGEEINIVYISPVLSYKNHNNVVEAITRIRSSGIKVTLNCIGSYEKNNAIVLANTKARYVNFLGAMLLDGIIEILNSTHVVVFASSCESFGITLLEKMASSIPLSTSRDSGLLDMVGVQYPFTFNPKDPSSIFNSIMLIISNYDYALSIGRSNREKARQYDWRNISAAYHEILYNEAVR